MARIFLDFGRRHVGETANCLIDGRIVMTARLLSLINGGMLQITGLSSNEIDALIPQLLEGNAAVAVEIKD